MARKRSNLRMTLRLGALGLATLTAYQCIFPVPNTTMSKAMAKHVLCDEPSTPRPEPFAVDLEWTDANAAYANELDMTVRENIRTGDRIKWGNLELTATDSRPQEVWYGENTGGALTMANLGCPGYVSFAVRHNGQLVGSNVEVVYGSPLYQRSMDGWPDFTLDDVLSQTDLSRKERRGIYEESAWLEGEVAAEKQRQYQAHVEEIRQTNIAARAQTLAADPKLTQKVANCQERFQYEAEGWDTYIAVVRRGDNPVALSREFNACSDILAFFPEGYDRVDTLHGSNAEILPRPDGTELRYRDGDDWKMNPIVHLGDRIRISSGKSYDLAAPTFEQLETIRTAQR